MELYRPAPEINSDKCTGEPAGSSLVSAPELGGMGEEGHCRDTPEINRNHCTGETTGSH